MGESRSPCNFCATAQGMAAMLSRRNITSSRAAASWTSPSVGASMMKSERMPLPESLNMDQGDSPGVTTVCSEGRMRVLTPKVSVTTRVEMLARLPIVAGKGGGEQERSERRAKHNKRKEAAEAIRRRETGKAARQTSRSHPAG